MKAAADRQREPARAEPFAVSRTGARPVATEATPVERRQADRQAALDRSSRVRRALAAPVIQREFVIDGERIPNDFVAWIKASAKMKDKLKGREGFSNKLMDSIANGLQNVAKTRDVTQDDLERVYGRAAAIVRAKIEENERALELCEGIVGSLENQEALKRVLQGGSLDRQVIYRGMTAGQALAVLSERTIGGAPRSQQPREPPSEEEAIVQTGENRKDAGRGLLEEWSLGEQTGFATGGVMLAALAPLSGVRPPAKGSTAERIGERGVTGWVDQPVLDVAIKSVGRASSSDPFQSGVDAFVKALGQKRFDLTTLL